MRIVVLFRFLAAVAAAILVPTSAAVADEATIINRPAEKYAIAPGGVDMRTGQYVYSQTDLQIGPAEGGLALTRTTPVYVAGHANPFGNFSHNWDIMLAEKRVELDPPQQSGPDYRMIVHIGGRSFVFESEENASAFIYKSDGPTAVLSYAGGTKISDTVVYTLQGPDGTLYQFRPLGGQDCAASWRCTYVSQIYQPDGTVYSLDYAYDSAASGNRAQLRRVTSSRGYVLMLESTSNLVTKACVINAATAMPPAGTSCPGTALATTTYTYTTGPKLSSAIAPDGGIWQFTYGTWTSGTEQLPTMSFSKPGQSAPWLTNELFIQKDEEEVPHEITNKQIFADGRTYTYVFDISPYTINKPYPSIVGGQVTDAQGNRIEYRYDWPILPGSRTCTNPPCPPEIPENELKYTYQQTTGPVLVIDELGRETRADYCDPVVKAGLPPQEIDRCSIIKDFTYIDPEGGSARVEHDPLGNVRKTTKYAKPGSSLAPIVTEAAFAVSNFKTQTKPLWRKDANGNQTDWTYDANHGGALTETGPAVNGIRPQKRYSYTQRYAWLSNGAGGYVQATTPVWLLTSESFCRTSAWSGSACAAGAMDEVVTTYDYGPNSGPNNLLLRGTTVTADGVTRRSCVAYDQLGRKISETSPNANLTSCP